MSGNIAEKIKPKDDAFHGSPKRLAAEWWYFDASLNDDLSVHIGFKTFTKKNKGMISPLIEFYNKGKLQYSSSNRYLLRRASISSDVPSVYLFTKPIIVFDIKRYEETGEWCYHVTLNIKGLGVNLQFIGLTEGWKIETPVESWTVALPKAKVTGTVKIKDKNIPVEGYGYHDHNWNYSLLTAMNYGKGWYWGKIRSETMTITWANIIKSSKTSTILSIINKEGNGFINIDPRVIVFRSSNNIRDHKRKTPTKFIFQIHDLIDNRKIDVDVEMITKELHHSKVLFAPYWRYHVHAEGTISLDGKIERVSDIQIMEYLKFDMF